MLLMMVPQDETRNDILGSGSPLAAGTVLGTLDAAPHGESVVSNGPGVSPDTPGRLGECWSVQVRRITVGTPPSGQTAMSSDPQALDLAMRHYQAGNLQQAEQIYRAILQVDPYQVDALHLLGLIAYQLG